MPRRTLVAVEFVRPRGVSHAELRAFITEALETWGGQRQPEDPLFASLEDVRVSRPIVPWRQP